MITFYDIPSLLPGKAFSPYTWRTRFTLNYKGIPYKTEFVEFPDIQPFCIANGIAPTSKGDDGSPYYTLPAIYDSSTGIYLADSLAIAQYLEKTYPETPVILPPGTEALQSAFISALASELRPMLRFVVPQVASILEGRSLAHHRAKREKMLGKVLEEIAPVGKEKAEEWDKLKEGFGKIDGWLKQNTKSGPSVMGDQAIWADFVLGGYLIFLKRVWGEESEEWKDIKSWHGGRWEGLLRGLQTYSQMN